MSDNTELYSLALSGDTEAIQKTKDYFDSITENEKIVEEFGDLARLTNQENFKVFTEEVFVSLKPRLLLAVTEIEDKKYGGPAVCFQIGEIYKDVDTQFRVKIHMLQASMRPQDLVSCCWLDANPTNYIYIRACKLQKNFVSWKIP